MQKVAEKLTESMPSDSRKRQMDHCGSRKPDTSRTPVVKVASAVLWSTKIQQPVCGRCTCT